MSIRARTIRLPLGIPLVIGVAWAVSLAVHATGSGRGIHHDGLLEEGLPAPAVLAGYATAWLVMVAAMMLPSAIPLLRLYAGASASQSHPGPVLAAFTGGYLAVWTLFGWLALALDSIIHRTVDAVGWLGDRPWLLTAGTLAFAGAFQFSGMKDRCLKQCRHPAVYLQRHYRRGARAAFSLGWGHGLFCLGCCWALMLVMFAVGVTDIRWMAPLAGLMAYEKIGRHGEAVGAGAGVALLVGASLIAHHPGWLPTTLDGG